MSNPPNPLITQKSREVLSHLVGADVAEAAKLLEKLLVAYFTRIEMKDHTNMLALVQNAQNAFLSVPLLAWRDDDGRTYNQQALVHECDEIIRWVQQKLLEEQRAVAPAAPTTVGRRFSPS